MIKKAPIWEPSSSIPATVSAGPGGGSKPSVGSEPANEAVENNETNWETLGNELSDAEVEAHIAELAKLPDIPYQRQRLAAAKALKMTASALDKLVTDQRPPSGGKGRGQALELPEFELWPELIDGEALLAAIVEQFGRFVAMSPGQVLAAALWVMTSHTPDAFSISPRFLITSATKGSGKSTLLEAVSRLVPRPLSSSNLTAAALFRSIEAWRPTILVDEADTFLFDPASDLVGIVNSGHRRSQAFVVRTVEIGGEHEPRLFSTWGPMAIASIGKPPPTIVDRSIIIELQKKRGGSFERMRADRDLGFREIGRKIARWAADHGDALAQIDPPIPAGLSDRAADNWRVLLAVADVVGGDYPNLARSAIATLFAGVEDEDQPVVLLRDIRSIFDLKGEDRITSQDLAEALADIEGRPWPEFGRANRPISPNQLARLLSNFGMTSTTIRIGERRAKGYHRKTFERLWVAHLEAETGERAPARPF